MIVNLFVRRNKSNPARVDVSSSLTREESDTPRISNLCLAIHKELYKMTTRLGKIQLK